tara:strand:- start:7214 stop:7390 length:177 start_codon:yes stop_codon:yes gene_type:complete
MSQRGLYGLLMIVLNGVSVKAFLFVGLVALAFLLAGVLLLLDCIILLLVIVLSFGIKI